jgi:hypothetical protein
MSDKAGKVTVITRRDSSNRPESLVTTSLRTNFSLRQRYPIQSVLQIFSRGDYFWLSGCATQFVENKRFRSQFLHGGTYFLLRHSFKKFTNLLLHFPTCVGATCLNDGLCLE